MWNVWARAWGFGLVGLIGLSLAYQFAIKSSFFDQNLTKKYFQFFFCLRYEFLLYFYVGIIKTFSRFDQIFEKLLETFKKYLIFGQNLTKIYSSGTRGLGLRARAWSGFAISPNFRARAYRAWLPKFGLSGFLGLDPTLVGSTVRKTIFLFASFFCIFIS